MKFSRKLYFFVFCFCVMTSSCSFLSGHGQKASDTNFHNLEELYGIKIIGIQPSAAGYMLDFRYEVIDPEKSAVLFHPTVKPYLIHQKSGKSLVVPTPPKVGALRQRSVRTAASSWTSFILFSNPGKMVQSSDKVTVVIGEIRFENLVVR